MSEALHIQPIEKQDYEMPMEETQDLREVKMTPSQIMAENSTITFLLSCVYEQITKRRLRVEHSFGDGIYCVDGNFEPITQEIVDQIQKGLTEALSNDTPIELLSTARSELIRYFGSCGYKDKVSLLNSWQDHYIPCIKFGSYVDYSIEPNSTNKERLRLFQLQLYSPGFVLFYPSLLSPNSVTHLSECAIQHEMFVEAEHWIRLLNTENVSDLNNAIYKKTVSDLIPVAEGLHERKIVKIADRLTELFSKEGKRIAFIAGPSASGKTTFAERVAIQLAVSGFESVTFSLDTFLRDKKDIPSNSEGLRDYYSVGALNIELIVERITALLSGETIPVRKYHYRDGKGYDDTENTLTLGKHAILLVEGLHGLNPQLLEKIGRDKVTTIYVQALTPLNIDFNHRFPTSDLRLIRRIIRDSHFRGIPTRETIKRWTFARANETRNVFPYMHNADMFFNSALVYELPVLYIQAKVLLSEAACPIMENVTEEGLEITKEASRLLALMDLFYPLSPEKVPKNSVIREFIGGSELLK